MTTKFATSAIRDPTTQVSERSEQRLALPYPDWQLAPHTCSPSSCLLDHDDHRLLDVEPSRSGYQPLVWKGLSIADPPALPSKCGKNNMLVHDAGSVAPAFARPFSSRRATPDLFWTTMRNPSMVVRGITCLEICSFAPVEVRPQFSSGWHKEKPDD